MDEEGDGEWPEDVELGTVRVLIIERDRADADCSSLASRSSTLLRKFAQKRRFFPTDWGLKPSEADSSATSPTSSAPYSSK
jgi:hypothetical protein